jgi:HEAT repeat protein
MNRALLNTIAMLFLMTLAVPSFAADSADAGEIQTLIRQLEIPDARDMAIVRLVELGGDAVPALSEALGTDDEGVFRAVTAALGRIGPDAKDAVPGLIGALEGWEWWLRCYASEALGLIGPDALDAAQKLRVLATVDRNMGVREAALQAVASIEGEWPEKREYWGYMKRFPDIPYDHW